MTPPAAATASIAHVSRCTTRSRSQRARAHGDRLAVLGERAPRERAEEPDRVVLRAVALPVAGDDVGPAAPARRAAAARRRRACRRRARATRGSARRPPRGTPGRAPPRRAARPRRAPNASSPSTGKPELRTAKSRHRLQSSASSRYSLECHSSQCRGPVKRKYDATLAPRGRGRDPRAHLRRRRGRCSSRDGYARTSIRAVAQGGRAWRRRRSTSRSRTRPRCWTP